MPTFIKFPRIPRYSRDIIITEKLDGTNAQIFIEEYDCEFFDERHQPYEDPTATYKNFAIFAGSRNGWISTKQDNFGFAQWVKDNAKELSKLGRGHHYGEWWGKGIQRGYGLDHRRFSLFNVQRWNNDNIPSCCHVVPILYHGPWNLKVDFLWENREEDWEPNYPAVDYVMEDLEYKGSAAAPGFMKPEGIVIYHMGKTKDTYFKKTFENDEKGKEES